MGVFKSTSFGVGRASARKGGDLLTLAYKVEDVLRCPYWKKRFEIKLNQ
jgi:hypothetical protein